jgi:hypothetical protein
MQTFVVDEALLQARDAAPSVRKATLFALCTCAAIADTLYVDLLQQDDDPQHAVFAPSSTEFLRALLQARESLLDAATSCVGMHQADVLHSLAMVWASTLMPDEAPENTPCADGQVPSVDLLTERAALRQAVLFLVRKRLAEYLERARPDERDAEERAVGKFLRAMDSHEMAFCSLLFKPPSAEANTAKWRNAVLEQHTLFDTQALAILFLDSPVQSAVPA